VPREQSLFRQRLVISLGGIEHHLDHAFDVPIGRRERANVDPETPSDRRADLLLIQHFALDLAGFQYVLGQRHEHSFGSKIEIKGFHSPDQPTLAMTHGRKALGDQLFLPSEIRPSLKHMYIRRHSPHLLR
jgi:hypothetical protein